MMWERFIELGLSFFINLVKGVYPLKTVLHLTLLGIMAFCAEGVVIYIEGRTDKRLRLWIREGVLSLLCSVVIVAVLAVVYRSLFRAFPELVGSLSNDAIFVAEISMVTVAVVLISIVLVQWIQGIRSREKESEWHWVKMLLVVTCVGAMLIPMVMPTSEASVIVYIVAGLISACITVVICLYKQEEWISQANERELEWKGRPITDEYAGG